MDGDGIPMNNIPVIIGGGLWGGLLAYRWNMLYPGIPFKLIEKDSAFGGNHTWSFHGSDVGKSIEWLGPFIEKSWDRYEVKFPDLERELKLSYHSITSEKFNSVLQSLPSEKFSLGHRYVSENQEGWKIDARGLCHIHKTGWQKFVGIEIKTRSPHGITNPVLMDALLPQEDGFRFIYYLPFSPDRLLVELTSYSNEKAIDEAEYEKVIWEKISEKNLFVESVLRKEMAALPIPLERVTFESEANVVNLAGIFHDTTGYSLPYAVKLIDDLLTEKPSLEFFQSKIKEFEKRIAKDRAFFRTLNRFMFKASGNQDRYKMLQFFYKHQPELISHFYAGELSFTEKIRFFMGKPPVSIFSAMKEVFG
jgi:lycopene beta-cyclase